MRRRRRPDPTARPDVYELAVERGGDGLPQAGREADAPLPRPRLGGLAVTRRGLLGTVVVLVLVGSLVRLQDDPGPELAPSCTEHALALSSERVRPGGLVRFTVVGPDGAVELSVNPVRDGADTPGADQPLPGTVLEDCRATGQFGVQVPSGRHVVTVLRDGEPVATRDLVVTEPGDPSGS